MSNLLPEMTVKIKPEWLDYNGHMNVAYYVLAFDIATDQFYEQLGIGEAYVQRGRSVFTLGMNVDYVREMFADETAVIQTQLLDFDQKRLRYIHQMFRQSSGELVATNECLGMHVDMAARKSTPFPAEILTKLEVLLADHRQVEPPPQAGRVLEIRRRAGAA